MNIDDLGAAVIDEAIGIHRQIGPGLFESVYEAVLFGRSKREDCKSSGRCQTA